MLHLGFVPALALGRLANLVCFALLAMAAVKYAPFGRRVFAAAALLPMTLHLAASFCRDALLLGLCFRLCGAGAAGCPCGTERPRAGGCWLALAAAGLLLCPGKAVYLPLAALVLLDPRQERLPLPRSPTCLEGRLSGSPVWR